jgi:electron transport complex protein RnfC
MIDLHRHEHRLGHDSPIESVAAPARVFVHLLQHAGKICAPEVKVGDRVLRGMRIGHSDAKVFVPVHSPVSGTVAAIDEVAHPVVGRSTAVVIDNDGKDEAVVMVARSPQQAEALSAAQLRQIAFEAGIAGMGGASFPTHIKLDSPKPLTALIVNGAECEPFLSADSRLMVEYAAQIAAGIRCIAHATGIKKVVVAIEENKPRAIAALRAVSSEGGFEVRVLSSQYPQGGEKQLIKSILKQEFAFGKLPFDVGALVHNVGTVYAIYQAVYQGVPLYERVLTVTGDCVCQPRNMRVRIGTPVRTLIEACGELLRQPKKIVFGGPMMGIAQHSADTPVIKSTSGVLLLSEASPRPSQEAACIRCARCVAHCPVGLMPSMITIAAERERWGLAKQYGCQECIECGVCDYVCPQRRNMVQEIKRAKAKVPR